MCFLVIVLSQRCGWSRTGACGGEETSDHPHVHGEQGELFRQKEHSPFQVSQETRGVRPHRHPVRYLGILEERLHNPEQVEGIVILGQWELVDGRTLRVLEKGKMFSYRTDGEAPWF